MSDARIVIDADADKVVVESGKAKRAIRGVSDEATRAARSAGLYTDASGRWREANGRFVSSARQAELGLQGVEKQTRRAASAGGVFEAAGKRQKRTLEELGRAGRTASIGLGALVAGGLTHLIKTGADFEAEMSRVKAVTNATGSEFKDLTGLAQRMGAQTKFSSKQAASAMYELASAGFSVAEIKKALPGTLSLAAASNIELADAAEISSNALRGFGLDASKSGTSPTFSRRRSTTRRSR